MGALRFDGPVLFMKLGNTALDVEHPTLGEAIFHVMCQPPDDRGLFDIVNEDGLINYTRMREIAQSDGYLIWRDENQAQRLQAGQFRP